MPFVRFRPEVLGTGKVVKGTLYVNNNPKAQALFDKDTQGTIWRAEHNWPAVKDQPL